MQETNPTEPNLVSPSDVINKFRKNCDGIAEKLGKSPESLKEEMVALSILIYEARTRGDDKFLVTFNDKGFPDIKGYKQKLAP